MTALFHYSGELLTADAIRTRVIAEGFGADMVEKVLASAPPVEFYDPEQPRSHGRWTSIGEALDHSRNVPMDSKGYHGDPVDAGQVAIARAIKSEIVAKLPQEIRQFEQLTAQHNPLLGSNPKLVHANDLDRQEKHAKLLALMKVAAGNLMANKDPHFWVSLATPLPATSSFSDAPSHLDPQQVLFQEVLRDHPQEVRKGHNWPEFGGKLLLKNKDGTLSPNSTWGVPSLHSQDRNYNSATSRLAHTLAYARTTGDRSAFMQKAVRGATDRMRQLTDEEAHLVAARASDPTDYTSNPVDPKATAAQVADHLYTQLTGRKRKAPKAPKD